MTVWLNGVLSNIADARIDPADRGLTLGDGLFETLRVCNGKIEYLDEHLGRLKNGCGVLQLPYPSVDLAAAMQSVLQANNLKDAILRLTLTRGLGPRGVMPPEHAQTTLLIVALPLPPVYQAARCTISTVTRRNEYSPLSRIKSLNYLDAILARQEAAVKNADEALLLNSKGFLVEATVGNLFIIKNGQAFTPPVSDGALPGVMRGVVMKETEAVEQSIKPDDLYGADEVFLTSSLGIRAIISVDGKTVGAKDAPVTQKLKAKF